ncbi:hypothetical protein Taro_038608, partial [Colocasia esculenta]|nr:hypothetical protein [Colocasia esculenta]
LIRRLRASFGDLLQLGGAPGVEESSPTPEDLLFGHEDQIWAGDLHLLGLVEEGFITKFNPCRFYSRKVAEGQEVDGNLVAAKFLSETGVPVLEEDIAMASRGRRGAQARDDEQRREERGEQQAPATQGPTVLPPPPSVDYGVFMQGLAQAPAPVPQEHGHGGPSIMERFKRMDPPSFKGESQPLLAESWMREVEKIFRAIRREPMFGGPPYYVLGTRMVPLRKAKKFVMGLKPSLRSRLVAFDHRTLDEALNAACRQESEMDQYLEEKRAALKRSAPPFQRQDKKKAVYQLPQHPVATSSQQAVTPQSPSFRPNDKKMCPHCGRAHRGTDCWKLAGKCLKCGSTEHQIRDYPRLQQSMKDYDAILGLDWIEEHYALVDCRGKEITFRIPRDDEFSHPLPRNLAGRFVISAMKAGRDRRSCRDMVKPEWPAVTGLVTHCTQPSRSCRDRGDVVVVLGARRRWSFLREGPNGSALLVEEDAPEPPSAEDATTIEVAILLRRPGRSRHDRDARGRRDVIASARAAATLSRQGRASRQGHDGSMRCDYSRETGYGLAKSRVSWSLPRSRFYERLLPLPGTSVLKSLLREYSGLRACLSWQPSRRTLEQRGNSGQSVLLLTTSLLVAPEPLGEARRGTVVWLDYGG